MKTPVKETEEQRQQRETVETIAKSISGLAKSVAALISGPLNRKALLVLLSSSSGQSKATVDAILVSLTNLEKDWLK